MIASDKPFEFISGPSMIACVVVTCVLFPFLNPSNATAAARPAVAANVSQQWAGSWNAKNLDAVMGLYAPDAIFLPTVGKAWHGKAEIRKECANVLAAFDPHITLHSERSESSGTLAFDTGTYEETIDPVKGGKSIAAKGSYLFLFKRGQGGRWRIFEQSWTELTPVNL